MSENQNERSGDENEQSQDQIELLNEKIDMLLAENEQLKSEHQNEDRRLAHKERRLAQLKAEMEETRCLARGEYFDVLDSFCSRRNAKYAGYFYQICGRMQDTHWKENCRLNTYTQLENELMIDVICQDEASAMSFNEPCEELNVRDLNQSDQKALRGCHSILAALEYAKARISTTMSKQETRRRKSSSSLGSSSSFYSYFSSSTPSYSTRLNGPNSIGNIETAAGAKIINSAGTVIDGAHLICSPTMGLFVQAIIGKNFEDELNDRRRQNTQDEDKISEERKKKILQRLAWQSKPFKGFIRLENNIVQVPKGGHLKFFDTLCELIIVPVMTLKQVMNWDYKASGYWVMVIANTPEAYRNFYQASMSQKKGQHVYVDNETQRCTIYDIETGLETLSMFIRAFADLATGHKEEGENQGKHSTQYLTPFDLLLGKEDGEILKPIDYDKIKTACNKLEQSGRVSVPMLSNEKAMEKKYNELHIMKVFVNHSNSEKLPDPMAVAAKGALNYMTITEENVIPVSSDLCSIMTPKASQKEMSKIPKYIVISPDEKGTNTNSSG